MSYVLCQFMFVFCCFNRFLSQIDSVPMLKIDTEGFDATPSVWRRWRCGIFFDSTRGDEQKWVISRFYSFSEGVRRLDQVAALGMTAAPSWRSRASSLACHWVCKRAGSPMCPPWGGGLAPFPNPLLKPFQSQFFRSPLCAPRFFFGSSRPFGASSPHLMGRDVVGTLFVIWDNTLFGSWWVGLTLNSK